MDFQAASGVTSSYDALLDLFECLANFLKRLEIYTTISPTQMMTDIITKIMVELLLVVALATRQINQGRFSECAVHIYLVRGSIMTQRSSQRSCWGTARLRQSSRDWID